MLQDLSDHPRLLGMESAHRERRLYLLLPLLRDRVRASVYSRFAQSQALSEGLITLL